MRFSFLFLPKKLWLVSCLSNWGSGWKSTQTKEQQTYQRCGQWLSINSLTFFFCLSICVSLYLVCLSVQDSDVLKYHVIPKELIFPDHLSDGTLKSTLLGTDYQVQFHLNDNNQVTITGPAETLQSCDPPSKGFLTPKHWTLVFLHSYHFLDWFPIFQAAICFR